MIEMTVYVIEYQGKDGNWYRVPRIFESMALAEMEAVYYHAQTRVVSMQEVRSK